MLPLYVPSLSPEEEQQVASVQAEPASEALAQVSTCETLPALSLLMVHVVRDSIDCTNNRT